MGNWSEWADQLQAELEKQSSSRAATLESLLFSGDYEAIRDWLTEWESEDSVFNSLTKRYQQALSVARLGHKIQQRQTTNPGAATSPNQSKE